MLTTDQINWIARKINEKVNLPILGEQAELMIITEALKKIDQILEKELPPGFKDFLNNTTAGIVPGSPTDIQVIKDNLIVYINEKIDIPIIGERAERKLIAEVIELIVTALLKGNKLDA